MGMEQRSSEKGLGFVVLACPKSGTTWMQRLMSAHAEVHCAESRLFGRYLSTAYGDMPRLTLEEYVSILSSYYHPPCEALESEAYFQTLLHKLIETIADHAREESGKRIYGEKLTPYIGTMDRVVEQLIAYDRNLRVIHLVRDCRDVVVSGIAHWRMLRGDQALDVEELFSHLLDSWIEIQSAMTQVGDRFAHVLEVRYEDMLEDPVGQARRVFALIGADCDPDLIQRCVEETSFAKLSGGRARGHEDSASFFRNGTAGQWKDRLSDEQIRRVHERAGALLAGYGYEVPADCPTS